MAFMVKFVTGDEKEFEGDVHQLSLNSRTGVGGMVALKIEGEKNSVYVNLEHIVYAQGTK